MSSRTVFLAAALLCGGACGESKGEQAPQTPAPEPAATAPAKDAAATKPSAMPPARTTPPGWNEYRNEEAGYRLVAPPKPPRVTDMGPPPKPGTPAADFQGMGQEFLFADCFGQILRMHYTGTETFDGEKGLDASITSMMSGVGVKSTETTSTPDEDRVARQFKMAGEWKGTAVEGLGRGIAVDDRTSLVILSLWKASDTACPDLGAFFVNSLTTISR